MTTDELILQLTRALAARKSDLDLPRTLSMRQVGEYTDTTRTMARTLTLLRNLPSDLARREAQLADLEARRAATMAKQAELEQALATAPDWRSFADARERDAEWQRQQDVRRSLQLLVAGQLPAFIRLDAVDARITELRARIASLRGGLDAHLTQAEQLLAAPVTQ